MSRIKEKKYIMKKKYIFWYRTWMGYCPSELKAGLSTRRAGGARGTQARRRRHGREGAGRSGTWALGAGVLGAQGERARGRRTLGRRAAGGHALQARGTGARQAGTWGAAGARGTAGLGVAWALDGCAGWASWASLVHCALGSAMARFLDPVRLGIFLSHQMNTVHCKIKFFRKKKIY